MYRYNLLLVKSKEDILIYKYLSGKFPFKLLKIPALEYKDPACLRLNPELKYDLEIPRVIWKANIIDRANMVIKSNNTSSFALSGLLCCSSELGFQEVHDWMVMSLASKSLLSRHCVHYFLFAPFWWSYIAVWFYFRLLLHFLSRGGLSSLLTVSSALYMRGLALKYLVSCLVMVLFEALKCILRVHIPSPWSCPVW